LHGYEELEGDEDDYDGIFDRSRGVWRGKKGLGEGIFLREVTLRRPGRPAPRGCRRAKTARACGVSVRQHTIYSVASKTGDYYGNMISLETQ
jgi:hypothetical protein